MAIIFGSAEAQEVIKADKELRKFEDSVESNLNELDTEIERLEEEIENAKDEMDVLKCKLEECLKQRAILENR